MYFRYADDQMILLNNPNKIEGLLLLLTRNLDRYGLRVNQKKVDTWSAAELQSHRCRSIQAIFTKKEDTKNPVLVRKFVQAYLTIPQNELVKTWNQGRPLLNRLLWSNLKSLPNSLYEKIVIRFTSEDYLLKADHKKLKQVYLLNSKRKKPIDFTARLKRLGKKIVHNAFHHEVVFFSRLIKDKALEDLFKLRLADIHDQMTGYEIK